jgi:F-type H+-transporting ATPase subunit epsilon
MYLEIVSPEKTLFNGDVQSVLVPGSDGSFQMLDNHAPIVSTLIVGTVNFLGVIIIRVEVNVIF